MKEFMPVGHPNVFFEFSQFQIDQVMTKCEHRFTLADIWEHVEIWRSAHANNIFLGLNETFSDMNEDDVFMLYEKELGYRSPSNRLGICKG